jgi:hypothetical protein
LNGVTNGLKQLIPKLEGVRRCRHRGNVNRYSLNVNRFLSDRVLSILYLRRITIHD